MKKRLKNEYHSQTIKELEQVREKLLNERRQQLIQSSAKQKNIRAYRELRKRCAILLTILKEKRVADLSSQG